MKYVTLTGRWIDYEKRTALWGPLAQQEATIDAEKIRLAALRLPDIGGEWANLAVSNVMEKMSSATSNISRFTSVRSRVLALLHKFVAEAYYARVFTDVADTTFGIYKRDVDLLIAEKAGAVLEKIPSVISRLREGDPEAISQALTTCRRILEAFADAIYPATDATVEIGGNVLKLDASRHQNRINAFIADSTTSASRRQRLRQNLGHLFDRVSTGVHNDVTTDEAYSIFLNVYLFLGEVLQLGRNSISETRSE